MMLEQVFVMNKEEEDEEEVTLQLDLSRRSEGGGSDGASAESTGVSAVLSQGESKSLPRSGMQLRERKEEEKNKVEVAGRRNVRKRAHAVLEEVRPFCSFQTRNMDSLKCLQTGGDEQSAAAIAVLQVNVILVLILLFHFFFFISYVQKRGRKKVENSRK